jgi:hypothetical protein
MEIEFNLTDKEFDYFTIMAKQMKLSMPKLIEKIIKDNIKNDMYDKKRS